jgi:single-stranded-DNA-specific exonuclease
LIKPIIAQHLFYQSGDKYAASARSVRIWCVQCIGSMFRTFGTIWRSHVCCGMTLKEENYQIFKDAFEKKWKNHSSDMLTPEIAVDAEIDFAYHSKINPNPETI